MDADDLDEALSDLGMSSIHSSPPAEEMADGSSNANIGVVPLVASSANLNQVATNTNVPNGSAAVTIVAQGTTNPPARHTMVNAQISPDENKVASSIKVLSSRFHFSRTFIVIP